MMLPITGCVQPCDLACGACRRECVQHRQNRCGADPGTEQYDRPLALLQNKTSARGADVSHAHLEILVRYFPAAPSGSIFTLIR